MAQPRQRWEGTFLAVLTVLAGMTVSGCAGHQTPAAPDDGGLQAVLDSDAAVYRSGQPVRLILTVTNRSPRAITFRFSTGQRYDFRILDAQDRIVWTWSEGRVFTMSLGSLTLEPGEKVVYEETYSGDLAAGEYRATGWIEDPTAGPEPAWTRFEVK